MFKICHMCKSFLLKNNQSVCYQCGNNCVLSKHHLFSYGYSLDLDDLAFSLLTDFIKYPPHYCLAFQHKYAPFIKSYKFITIYIKEIIDVLFYSFNYFKCDHIYFNIQIRFLSHTKNDWHTYYDYYPKCYFEVFQYNTPKIVYFYLDKILNIFWHSYKKKVIVDFCS